MKKLGLGLILFTGAFVASAQSFYAARKERSLLLVAGTGTSTYFGEMADNGDYFDARPNLNVGLQYYLNNRFSLRTEITWFTLKGSDAASKQPEDGRIQRNLSFTSQNYEVNLSGIVSLGQKYALRPLRTELVDYSSFGVVIPYGLGMRFKIHPLANISVEGGYRKTFTDYLDDVSTVHAAQSSFTDPIAQALTDRRPEIGLSLVEPGHRRGNPKYMDSYFLLNVKLEYYLPTEFLSANSSKKLYKSKRKAFYRYNKRGGVRRRR
jgi:hypothetical protein